jgi:hypothetical protein
MAEATQSSSRVLTNAIMKSVRAMRASAFIAAIAAALTAFTALSVYRGEQERLHYDRMKYTHSTYHSYIEYRRTKGPTLRCSDVLADVPNQGRTVTNDDLQAIVLYEASFPFKYVKERHATLRECVDEETVKKLFDHDTWTPDETKQVLTAITNKMAWTVTVLDAALIGYYHNIGDKIVLCENFGGFLMAGKRASGYGIPGRYLRRLMSPELQLLREDNYPNIYRFTTDVAFITNDFAGTLDCKRLAELYPDTSYVNQVREWALRTIKRISG